MTHMFGSIQQNSKKGFTLIELMISILVFTIIIAILGSVFYSTIGMTNRSNEVMKEKGILRQAHLLIEKEVNTSNPDYEYDFTQNNKVRMKDSLGDNQINIESINNKLVINGEVELSGVSSIQVIVNAEETMFEVILVGENKDFKLSKVYSNNRFKKN